jgi:hypothetical protein
MALRRQCSFLGKFAIGLLGRSKVNLAAGFLGTLEFEIGAYERRPTQRFKNSAALRRFAGDRPADGGANPG